MAAELKHVQKIIRAQNSNESMWNSTNFDTQPENMHSLRRMLQKSYNKEDRWATQQSDLVIDLEKQIKQYRKR